MLLNRAFLCVCVCERDRESQVDETVGMGEIRHTVVCAYVPKLGLELKWKMG